MAVIGGLLLCLFVADIDRADAASSSATVGATVLSATSLDVTGCLDGVRYRQGVLADAPVGYWRLGEPAGTSTAPDESGGAHAGSYVGATAQAPGLLKGDSDAAAAFDGINDYVTIPDAVALRPTAQVTVEAWISAASINPANWNFIASKNGAYQLRVDPAVEGGRLSFFVSIGGSLEPRVSAMVPVPGRTYHVVGTYDGATMKLYVDGALAASQARAGAFDSSAGFPTTLGAANATGSMPFGGTIDDVAVYDTALSAARIQAHYTAGTSGNRAAFGLLATATSNVTSSDCNLTWGSSNSTSMLKLYQADGGGNALLPAPQSGIAGYWPMNGNGTDLSPLQRTLVPTNGASYTAGSAGPPGRGDALTLDGVDDVGVVPHDAGHSLDVFTVDLWFKTSVDSYGTLAIKELAPNDRNFAIYTLSGQVCASVSVSGVTADRCGTTVSYAGSGWHHFAAVFDTGDVLRTYFDGVQNGSWPLVGNVDNPVANIGIGAYVDGAGRLNGQIDEVRIHDVARSANEIRSYYAGVVDQYSSTGGAGDTDWASPSATSSTFGACLRAVSGAGVTGSWTVDAGCPATDGAFWNPIPATSASAGSKVAASPTVGVNAATASLRFGFRTATNQAPGSYSAPVVFEVTAPNV